MRRGRHLVAVILVYVTVDLCVAAMPGAFVFDAGDSVESALMGRARHVTAAAAACALPAVPGRTSPAETAVLRPRPAVTRLAPAVIVRRIEPGAPAAATPVAPPAPEDPLR